MKHGHFLNLFKVVRNAPEHKEITQFLIGNHHFKKVVHHVEYYKSKFW